MANFAGRWAPIVASGRLYGAHAYAKTSTVLSGALALLPTAMSSAIKRANRIGDLANLGFGQLWKHWKTENRVRGRLGDGERSPREPEVAVGWLKMERHWIVQPGPHTMLRKVALQPVALVCANHKQVVHVGAVRGFGRQDDLRKITERISLDPADADRLVIETTFEDPKALTRPWKQTSAFTRSREWEQVEFVCAENDRNPVGEGGKTGFVLRE